MNDMLITNEDLHNLIRNVISETLGVPDNINETTHQLYNDIISELELKKDTVVGNNFMITVDGDYKIGKKLFKTFTFEFLINYNNGSKSLKHADGEYVNTKITYDLSNLRIIYDQSPNNNKIAIYFDCPYGKMLSRIDIIRYLIANKNAVIQLLIHEIKHYFDSTNIPSRDVNKKVEYNSYTNALHNRNTVAPITIFIYMMYYVDDFETLVRTSELYNLLIKNKVKRNNFKQFIEKTEIYKKLTAMKNFSVDIMIDDLKTNYIDEVNGAIRYNSGTENLTDEEKVQLYLKNVYIALNTSRIQGIENIIANLPAEIVNNIKSNNKVIRKQFLLNDDSYLNYFYDKQKLINRKASETLLKIHKLYGLLTEMEQAQIVSDVFCNSTSSH